MGEDARESFTLACIRAIVEIVSHLPGIAYDWIQMGRSGLQLSLHHSRKVEGWRKRSTRKVNIPLK